MKQVDNDEYIHTKLTKGKTPERVKGSVATLKTH